MSSDERLIIDVLRERSLPATVTPIADAISGKRVALLGEASHGTSEYYTWRARISQRLIEEQGFRFIAVEGDWPDCYELNRYVKGWAGTSARDVLHQFDRWPTWMWANWEVVALAEWMRAYNQGRQEEEKVGFYGLDVYSLWESLAAVYGHLKEFHPQQLEQAMNAISCFEPFNREAQVYAWHTRFGQEDCEQQVVELLKGLVAAPSKYPDDPEAHFNAEQNAMVAVNAERYYRAMVRADNDSWNVRDIHMADTLERLLEFHGAGAKAIVWEHNTHIGDARYTDMAEAGMTNIGQIARERYGEDAYLLGFGSYQGTVIGGREWGAQMEVMAVPPGRKESWEALFHEAVAEDRLLFMRNVRDMEEFEHLRGHRAIGVVYRPEYERLGNYVPTDLSRRYDAFLYVEQSSALHPLHIHEHASHEPPETYPWGV